MSFIDIHNAVTHRHRSACVYLSEVYISHIIIFMFIELLIPVSEMKDKYLYFMFGSDS